MEETVNKNESYRPQAEEFPLKKQLLLFGVGWMGFKIIGAVLEIIFVLGFMISDPNVVIKDIFRDVAVTTALNSLAYAGILIAMIFISNVDFKKFKNSATKWQSYLAGILGFVAIYLFTIFYQTFLEVIGAIVKDNSNEETVVSVANAYPIISLIIVGFVAPICEELTYRVGLFGALSRKNKLMAYLVSISVFALIHFTLDPTNIVNELLNIPYYFFAGFILTYLYDRYGYAASVTTHILNNSFSQILRMILK